MRSPKAFTLAELLVGVTILAIVSSATVYSLGGFSKKFGTEAASVRITSPVADLDRAVRDGSIGSYELGFQSGALGFVSVTDVSGLAASGSLQDFDWESSSGAFLLSAPTSAQWTVRIAQDGKIVRTVSVPGSSATVPFAFDSGRRDSYSASFYYDSEPQNRIVMTYFDRDNLLVADEFRLKFAGAVVGTSEYPSFAIRNVLGKKEFLAGGSPVGAATLRLVRGNEEYLVDIRK